MFFVNVFVALNLMTSFSFAIFETVKIGSTTIERNGKVKCDIFENFASHELEVRVNEMDCEANGSSQEDTYYSVEVISDNDYIVNSTVNHKCDDLKNGLDVVKDALIGFQIEKDDNKCEQTLTVIVYKQVGHLTESDQGNLKQILEQRIFSNEDNPFIITFGSTEILNWEFSIFR